METKLDSRQGQFPASFPDTFKNFFAMMNEDEDHMDLFSNLLEDKVIPRTTKFNQRRCGGSLRCNTHPNAGAGGACGSGSVNHNVGRSNSFRVYRPRNTFTNSTTTLNNMSSNNIGSTPDTSGGSGGGLFCKHIKYCCLHQQQKQQMPHRSNSNQQLFQQTQPMPVQHQHEHQEQQQQQSYATTYAHQYIQPNYHNFASTNSAGTRLGPDGEDNNDSSTMLLNDSNSSGIGNGGNVAKSNHQQQQSQTQKRHSIILERAFDFDASCDESDTISTTSSTPASNIPYNVLKPILKQTQHTHTHSHIQQQQQYQQQQNTNQMIVQQPTSAASSAATSGAGKPITKDTLHRTLPQPPKGVGYGAYHTKETALQRVQQQSGLLAGSKTNLSALCGAGGIGGSSTNLSGNNCSANSSSNSSGNNNSSSGLLQQNDLYNMQADTGSSSGGAYMDLNSPTATQSTGVNKFNDLLTASNSGVANSTAGAGGSTSRNNLSNLRTQKSPILTRRRSSSIAANLFTADVAYNRSGAVTPTNLQGAHSNADELTGKRSHGSAATTTMSHNSNRDRISLVKSPIGNKPNRIPLIPVESGVLTFQQAMSGAVSPQYTATSPMMHRGADGIASHDIMGSSTALSSVQEDSGATNTTGGGGGGGAVAHLSDSPTALLDSPTGCHYERTIIGAAAGVVGSSTTMLHGSSATIAQLGSKQKQRLRTSSMPAESRKPRLADTRRAAIHCADLDLEYYRLRSFSITSHGVCNLGDSLRSRRSRSINSVTSTGTSNSGKDRNNSNASRTSGDIILEQTDKRDTAKGQQIPAYKVAMLGASGVGKTTLTYQFTTSEYICAYDLSLDDDYGQKTVSVLVDGIETDLEIIDHPACEMSTEAFCSTYNIDLFVVVYSVVDRSSFKAAEKVLQYLKENEMLLTRGAILVGNKTDLERHREVNRQMGRKVAKDIACKFIETSSGLDHNVDELLVGIVAQVKLNPQRIRNLSERDKQRLNLQSTIQKHRRMHLPQRRMVRQLSMHHADDSTDADCERDENQPNSSLSMIMTSNIDEGMGSERTASTSLSSSSQCGPVRKPNKRALNLENILKMGESEQEDEEEVHRHMNPLRFAMRPMTKFELLTSGRTPFGSLNSSPKSRHSNDSNASGGGNVGVSSGRSACTTGSPVARGTHYHRESQIEDNLLDDCNRKTMSKLTNRTKIFLSSVLKFKKAINVKRRSSSNCSDLFVI